MTRPPIASDEVAIRPAEQRLDPAHQLAQAERLRQVVVGAELEADDLVDLVVAGGQDEDRHLGAGGAEAAQDLEAVDPGQADVEDDEVGRLVRRDVEALLAGAGDGDLVAFLLERVLDAARDGVLVFDDEDGGGHAADATPARPGSPARGGRAQRAPWYPVAAFRAPRRSGPAGEPQPVTRRPPTEVPLQRFPSWPPPARHWPPNIER